MIQWQWLWDHDIKPGSRNKSSSQGFKQIFLINQTWNTGTLLKSDDTGTGLTLSKNLIHFSSSSLSNNLPPLLVLMRMADFFIIRKVFTLKRFLVSGVSKQVMITKSDWGSSSSSGTCWAPSSMSKREFNADSFWMILYCKWRCKTDLLGIRWNNDELLTNGTNRH